MRLADLAPRAKELSDQRVPFVQAVVVRAQRPTSVRPGNAAIVHADGSIEGFVGGACAETSVRLHGLRVLETGEPLLLELRPDEEASDDLREGVVTTHNPCLSGGELEIFLEPCLPAASMLIAGHGPIAEALADLAGRVGFHVTSSDLAPDAAAVVVAAHGRDEEELLAEALRQGVPYVALVASPKRGGAVRASLELPDELRRQLHSPAGLDIGARTPAEIAVSILAEILAERQRVPAHRVTGGPVTATDPVCGMEVAVTDAAISLERDGEHVYFCSEGCRERYGAPR
jgi:xanthine dehydrogenase accessory factor